MKEGNNPELIFINKLRETFSNQFGEEFSNNKLSGFFGSSALFNETLRKKRNFSERILFRFYYERTDGKNLFRVIKGIPK